MKNIDTYPSTLEEELDLPFIMQKIEKIFNQFIINKNESFKNEIHTLSLIKAFLFEEQKEIQIITKGTQVQNFDCLTMSIITCILAHKKGYTTVIARPTLISRYFHTVILRSNGTIFKVAGKRTKYNAKFLTVDEVTERLKHFNYIITPINRVRKFIGL